MARSFKDPIPKFKTHGVKQQKVAVVCVLGFLGIGFLHNMNFLKQLTSMLGTDDTPPAPTFAFGAASAAYQIEGAANEGGRGPSIWDTFSHTPGKTDKGDTGDVAIDFYHRFASDIQLMKSLGIKMFRMSISWPRIYPQGIGKVNIEGVAFYNAVINKLLEAGIEPHLTLYHWDMPQALEDKYGGLLSPQVVNDFTAYAETCFKEFGDRVKHWTTFNEPWTFIFLGYDQGTHAPGRCSDRSRCSAGDSSTEPWFATHNVLNAHAAAVAKFRKIAPTGKISINLNCDWAEPMSSSQADSDAAQRRLDFTLGLYADPIYFGSYPESVKKRIPALPAFTQKQRELLQGSTDYFALNHYTTNYCEAANFGDAGLTLTPYKNGRLIGAKADSEWLHVVPWGFGKLLSYVQDRYSDPEIYVTESGVDVPKESTLSLAKALKDDFRVKYYKGYLREAMKVVQEKQLRLKGYFAWSIFDNFEWADGYAKRFGIVYVDYSDQLRRHVKRSAAWLSGYFAPTD